MTQGASYKGLAARLTEIAQAHPEAERFEIWSQDEARVGQKGRTGYVWWQRDDTPRAARCQPPVRLGHRRRMPGTRHDIVLMDNAGWYTSGDLVVPENLSLVFLPPYSPELNPIERLWLHHRDNRLSHCVFQTTH